jgi:hypothetical protein
MVWSAVSRRCSSCQKSKASYPGGDQGCVQSVLDLGHTHGGYPFPTHGSLDREQSHQATAIRRCRRPEWSGHSGPRSGGASRSRSVRSRRTTAPSSPWSSCSRCKRRGSVTAISGRDVRSKTARSSAATGSIKRSSGAAATSTPSWTQTWPCSLGACLQRRSLLPGPPRRNPGREAGSAATRLARRLTTQTSMTSTPQQAHPIRGPILGRLEQATPSVAATALHKPAPVFRSGRRSPPRRLLQKRD